MLAALPLLVHAFFKLRVLAWMLAELGVAPTDGAADPLRSRRVFADMFWVAFLVVVGGWILTVGVAILPPWPVLGTVLVLLCAIAVTMRKRFARFYAHAQLSLRETLAENVEEAEQSEPLSARLREVRLETIEIGRASCRERV